MPALADGQVVASAPTPWLLVASLGVGLAAFSLWRLRRIPPQAFLLVALVVLATLSGMLGWAPKRVSARNIRVEIVEPEDGATVPSGHAVIVRARVAGGFITRSVTSTNSRAGHLHIYVDDVITAMPSEDRTVIRLAPGRHTVEVQFVTPAHLPFVPPVRDRVRVRAVARSL